MKYSFKLLSVVIVLIFVAISCEKEGVYKPKQKIDRIYFSEINVTDGDTTIIDKYLLQDWTWDGNQLKTIDYFLYDGSLRYTETYSYDKQKRLAEIKSTDGTRSVLKYEDGLLVHVDSYEGDVLTQEIDFTYDGKQLTESKNTIFSNAKSDAQRSMSIYRFIFPNITEHTIQKMVDRINNAKASGNTFTISYQFEWEGKNISNMVEKWDLYNFSISTHFFYDNKVNPFRKFFNFQPLQIWSANNVIRYVEDGDSECIYTYTYDGNYPTSNTWSSAYANHNISYTEYYEYE